MRSQSDDVPPPVPAGASRRLSLKVGPPSTAAPVTTTANSNHSYFLAAGPPSSVSSGTALASGATGAGLVASTFGDGGTTRAGSARHSGASDWELTAACRHLCAVARRCDAALGGYHAAAAASVTAARARGLQQSLQTAPQSWDWPLQFEDVTATPDAAATAAPASSFSHAASTYRRFCPTTIQCASSHFASGGRLPGLGGGGHTQIRAGLDRIYRGLPGTPGTCGFGIGLPVPAYTYPHGVNHATHQSAVTVHGSALPESTEAFRYAVWLAELDRVVGFMRPPQVAAALNARRQRGGEPGAGIEHYDDPTHVGERIRFEEAVVEVVMRSWAEEYQRQGCPTALPPASTFLTVPAAAAGGGTQAAAAGGESTPTLWALLTHVMPVPGTLVEGLPLPHFLPLGRPWPAPPAAAASGNSAATAFRSFISDGSTGGSDLLEDFVLRLTRYRRDERERARLRDNGGLSFGGEGDDDEASLHHLVADGALALRVLCCLMRLDRDPACGRFRHSLHLERSIEIALLNPTAPDEDAAAGSTSGRGGRPRQAGQAQPPLPSGGSMIQQLLALNASEPRTGPPTRSALRMSPAAGAVLKLAAANASAAAGGAPSSPAAAAATDSATTGILLPVATEAMWTVLDARRALFPAATAALSESAVAGMRVIDGMWTQDNLVFAYPVSDVQGPHYASKISNAGTKREQLTPTSIATLHAALRYGQCVLDPALATPSTNASLPLVHSGKPGSGGGKGASGKGDPSGAAGSNMYAPDQPPTALIDALRQINACSRVYNGAGSDITKKADALVSDHQRKIRLAIKHDLESVAITAWYERRPPAFNFIRTTVVTPAATTTGATNQVVAAVGGARRRPRSGEEDAEANVTATKHQPDVAAAQKTRKGAQRKGSQDAQAETAEIAQAGNLSTAKKRPPATSAAAARRRGRAASPSENSEDADGGSGSEADATSSGSSGDDDSDDMTASVVSDDSDVSASDAARMARGARKPGKRAAAASKSARNQPAKAASAPRLRKATAASAASVNTLERLGTELDSVRLELHHARPELDAIVAAGTTPDAAMPSDETLERYITHLRSMLQRAEHVAAALP